MPKFEVGQEWNDGWGNFIIVKVEDRPTVDEESTVQYVTTFDYEGVIETQPWFEWQAFINDMPLTPVDGPLDERLASWRSVHNTFPPSIFACPDCGHVASNDGEKITCTKCEWSAWSNNI